MTIEDAVLQNLQTLPFEKKQEVLDFVEFLHRKSVPKQFRRNPIGLFAELKLDITEADIAEARRELWGKFPREIDYERGCR